MTRDVRGRTLVAILRRRCADLEATFERYGLTPAEAVTVLDDAVLEVQLRCERVEDMEARLLRAVVRGCTAAIEERRPSASDDEGAARPSRSAARAEGR